MKRYKKGITTKNNIIHVSKTLFYFHGYRKTTVQKISELANVNLGLLSYYFTTKKNIVKECLDDYLERIDNFISDNTNCEDPILKLFITQRIYYNIIFNNNNNLTFYKELVENNIIYDVSYDQILKSYKEIADILNLNLTEDMIKCCISFEVGGKYSVLTSYFNNQFEVSYEELVSVIICCKHKVFSLDKNILDDYLEESKKIVDDLDYSSISFLINNN